MNPTSYARWHKHSCAFTLTELLTVIAIIGILVAIIIPIIGKVRSNARASQCVSNLRQIGVAMLVYASENKNQYPAAVRHGGRSWDMELKDYGVTKDVLHCAVDEAERSPFNNGTASEPRSYGMNDRLASGGYNPTGYIHSARIEAPPQTIALSEWHVSGNRAWVSGNAVLTDFIGGDTARGNFTVHGEVSGNALFFDGHVETLRKNQANIRMFYWVK